jgi:uncharacterized hydrophobic protein (TIGR00271 family)
MLHLRVVSPGGSTQDAVHAVESAQSTANLAVVKGVCLAGEGDLLLFDVARERANDIVSALRDLGIVESGSISISEPSTVLSRAAETAEEAAQGHPSDGIVWEEIEEKAKDDARISWSFITFLILATLIAGVGRYLDQPILIIGAMVVGPEFAPIAALCIAVARRRRGLALPATLTLLGGFAIAAAVAWVVWVIAYAAGAIDVVAATTGSATDFIIKPDAWSFVIALLAGCAGMLSLTSAKSSALVGVFISITTVPAAGTLGLTLAVGAWEEAGASGIQLAVNIVGLIIAGIATLKVQSLLVRASRRRRIKAVANPGPS